MFADAKRHSMERIAATPIALQPFAHIVVENIFPDAFYAELRRRLLPTAAYRQLAATGRVSKSYNPARHVLMSEDLDQAAPDPDSRKFWKNLFATYCDDAFTHLWLTRFESQIRERMKSGDVPFPRTDAAVDLRREMILMRGGAGYYLPPHTDSPSKVVSVLFYLPEGDAHADAGTVLYTAKNPDLSHPGGPYLDRAGFDPVKTLPFRRNTLVAFPKSSTCFHGVEPVTNPELRRDILLFDIRFALDAPAGAGGM